MPAINVSSEGRKGLCKDGMLTVDPSKTAEHYTETSQERQKRLSLKSVSGELAGMHGMAWRQIRTPATMSTMATARGTSFGLLAQGSACRSNIRENTFACGSGIFSGLGVDDCNVLLFEI